MSNVGNYSLYNLSYRFIQLQNQAYHIKNKNSASPQVKTNLYHSHSRYSSAKNPEKKKIIINQNHLKYFKSTHMSQSLFFPSEPYRIQNPILKTPRRVIHKNRNVQRQKQQKVAHQNIKFVDCLINGSCQIIKKKQTDSFFSKHLKYENIYRKFDQSGHRKDKMLLGNKQMLCSTLRQFNRSKLGKKFIINDMSMLKRSQTQQKMRKSDQKFI